ncbi:hypothetical protein LCGC14_2236860, partial [marine sediment metagenome]
SLYAALTTAKPDLIILDIGLPDINGREVALKLKQNPRTRGIPILFLTALYSKEDETRKKHMLDDNVLFTKPYDREEFQATIKKLLKDKKKILIVDDQADVLSMLGKRLVAEKYSVIKADNGEDALILARSEHPDLIILDLEMSDMYGGDIARMIKEDPETADIPVMFLTGMFPKEDEEKGGHVIAGHVLFAKPYDARELVTVIKELL